MRGETPGLATLANRNNRHQRKTLPMPPPGARFGPAVLRLAAASSLVSAAASLKTAYRQRLSPILRQGGMRCRLSR